MNTNDSELGRSIPEAVTAWARATFGAPRNLAGLVTGPPEVRDETIERVFTHVVRREIGETSAPTSETRSTQPRLDKDRIDPFAYTSEGLKADSEYVRHCGPCGASGSTTCPECAGGGKMRCRDCNGSGQELKYYKTRSPKVINCKACRAKGVVRCTGCDATGRVTCRGCYGSGHVLVWLTFEQTDRFAVAIEPDSPIVYAHPALREQRVLPEKDLSSFAVVHQATQPGPLDVRGFEERDRRLPSQHLGQVDPRLERVQTQQYLKLAVVRRDVHYEMCGTRGTLVLSGKELLPSKTSEALRPIRRRLYTWIASVALVGGIGSAVRDSMVGGTKYFDQAKQITAGLIAAGIVFAIPAMGAMFRSWRGGLRFWRIRPGTIAALVGMTLSIVAIAVVGLVVRPTKGELQDALTAGDAQRARVVVDALKEQGGSTPEALDADDRVKLAEAGRLTGDARLAVLDAVAARHGALAQDAAVSARKDRLATVRGLIAAKDSVSALAALDRWFPAKDVDDPEVAEERARAHELARAACATDACRLLESKRAGTALETAARTAAIQADREKLSAALDPRRIDAKETLDRLIQAQQLEDAASQTLASSGDDPDLGALAQSASKVAREARANVGLLRSTLPVIEELLGNKSSPENKNVARVSMDGLTIYIALDSSSRCSGMYVIGAGNRRAYASKLWPPDLLLSQALGKPATVRQPTQGSAATSRWYEAGIPVIVRWHDGELIEMRIGDATP